MNLDEIQNAKVVSELMWNNTGIELEKGCIYQIYADPADQTWVDGKRFPQICKADGFSHIILNLFSCLKRHRPSRWFCMIGSINEDEESFFEIGLKTEYKPEKSGTLHCFANDAKSYYDNNKGSIEIKVKRIS